MPAFDRERAAGILLDAILMGDAGAAEKWKCSVRTVENHRKRAETDPDFAAFFQKRQARQTAEWRTVRVKFLRNGIRKLEALIELATTPEHIPLVSDAIKMVGELQIASDALNVDPAADHEGDPAEGVSPRDPSGSRALH